jgi:hypothetical protein
MSRGEREAILTQRVTLLVLFGNHSVTIKTTDEVRLQFVPREAGAQLQS